VRSLAQCKSQQKKDVEKKWKKYLAKKILRNKTGIILGKKNYLEKNKKKEKTCLCLI